METTMMRMRSVSISSSIPKAKGGAISVGSSSSLCFGSPKLLLLNSAKSARVSVRTKRGLSCNALFGLGMPELVVIAGVAALVFGPKKLPEVGRSIGKTVKSFQQAAKEFESELKKEPDSIGGDSFQKPFATVSEQLEEGEKQDNQVSTSKDTL